MNAQFQREKAIAAMGHVVQQTQASMYSVMKMMYLADKLHLERYGRFIAGDTYAAMKQGPVPSHAYNLVKCVRGESESCPGDVVAREFFAYGADDHSLKLLRDPDLDELSESDIRCLDVVIETYKKMGHWAVRDMSHDDAWKAAWKSARRKSFPMSVEAIAGQLEGAERLVAHLRDNAPGRAN
ncbi:MAG: Panacea domain-containing protein [Pseudoxanthomonas sp.]